MRPERLLDFLEATYALEIDELTWLNTVVAALKAVWGAPGWAFGTVYDASDVTDLRPALITLDGAQEAIAGVLAQGATLLTPAYVQRNFRRTLTFFARHGANPELAAIFEELERAGAADLFVVNGCDPGGIGCALAVSTSSGQKLSPAELAIYRRMAVHVATALRCRRRLAAAAADGKPDPLKDAEAVFDRRGHLVHAEGPAKLRNAQNGLRDALRRYDAARSRSRGSDPLTGLERHRPLVDTRWTLVQAYERRGVRYVVARENRAAVRGLATLSERERQVVVYLALGRSTKEIAYSLGISDSTVRVLVSRAATRLRARNRQQLVQLATRQALPELAAAKDPE